MDAGYVRRVLTNSATVSGFLVPARAGAFAYSFLCGGAWPKGDDPVLANHSHGAGRSCATPLPAKAPHGLQSASSTAPDFHPATNVVGIQTRRLRRKACPWRIAKS